MGGITLPKHGPRRRCCGAPSHLHHRYRVAERRAQPIAAPRSAERTRGIRQQAPSAGRTCTARPAFMMQAH